MAVAELETEAASAAGLTLKRNNCRSKQSTLVEEINNADFALVSGAVGRGRPSKT